MKSSVLLLSVLAVLAIAVPVAAQSPSPQAAPSLANPNYRRQHKISGLGCNRPAMANRAATTVNPINGQPQAAPIVAIPLGKNGGSVANATTHAQQTQACAQHTH